MQPSLFAGLAPQASAGSDVAYTPDDVAEACVDYLIPNFVEGPCSWWDPCAGGGAFPRALQRRLGPGHATELDAHAESVRSGLAVVGDALQGPPSECAPTLEVDAAWKEKQPGLFEGARVHRNFNQGVGNG